MSAIQSDDVAVYTEIINRVMLYCQLPLVRAKSTTAYPNYIQAGSDAYMAHTLIQQKHRTELSKGWWFNTVRNLEIEPNGTSSYTYVDSNERIMFVVNRPQRCQDKTNFTFWKEPEPSDSFNKLGTLDSKPSQFKGLIDLILHKDIQACPEVYVDYIAKATAVEFGMVIGINVNPDLEMFARDVLEKENVRQEERLNVHNL